MRSSGRLWEGARQQPLHNTATRPREGCDLRPEAFAPCGRDQEGRKPAAARGVRENQQAPVPKAGRAWAQASTQPPETASVGQRERMAFPSLV